MIEFNIYGHKNILSKHKNTLEFIKDKEVTKQGDCIIGVASDFSIDSINSLENKRLKLQFYYGLELLDQLSFTKNNEFNDENEIVIRKSSFISPRTLGIKASKAASELNPKMIELLKDPNTTIKVVIN